MDIPEASLASLVLASDDRGSPVISNLLISVNHHELLDSLALGSELDKLSGQYPLPVIRQNNPSESSISAIKNSDRFRKSSPLNDPSSPGRFGPLVVIGKNTGFHSGLSSLFDKYTVGLISFSINSFIILCPSHHHLPPHKGIPFPPSPSILFTTLAAPQGANPHDLQQRQGRELLARCGRPFPKRIDPS